MLAPGCALGVQEGQAALQAAQQGSADRDEALDALADELVEVNAGLEEAEATRQQAEEQVRLQPAALLHDHYSAAGWNTPHLYCTKLRVALSACARTVSWSA